MGHLRPDTRPTPPHRLRLDVCWIHRLHLSTARVAHVASLPVSNACSAWTEQTWTMPGQRLPGLVYVPMIYGLTRNEYVTL